MKICILRLSALGDVTHVVPVVLALQEQTDVEITWIIGKLEYRLVSGLPGVNFLVYDKREGAAGRARLKQALAGQQFDVLLQMQVAWRANWLSTVIRAKRRIGYDRARSKDLHSFFINERIPAVPAQHVRDCLASFLLPLGLPPAPPRWYFELSNTDKQFAAEWLEPSRPNVVISPCSSHALRNWLPERYAAVADYLCHHFDANVLLVGGPSDDEKQFVASIERHMKTSARNLAGKDTLKQLVGLMQQADLVIAPDTGPTHIASAVGTPVIGLYAASNPLRSGPYSFQRLVVNRYPDAIRLLYGKAVEEVRWGKKAEKPGVMALITVDDVISRILLWAKERNLDVA